MNADFHVVTAYFNLTGSAARRANYDCFRRALAAPLLTIEWHPDGRFALGPGDADTLIQLSGGDPMWQKERLLGIAFRALPDAARHVAWIDCDMVFAGAGWIDATRAALERHAVVQPFARVAYLDGPQTVALHDMALPAADAASAATVRESFLHLYDRVGPERIVAVDLDTRFASGARPTAGYDVRARPAYGHAWAARRDVLDRMQLYDRCVMGAGDLLFAYGVVGHSAALIDNHRSVGWGFYGDCGSYRDWAAHAHAVTGGRCASTNDTVLHLHHGRLEDRQYTARLDGLKPFAIDLDRDLAALEREPWSWTRRQESLSDYFMRYLENRRDDG